MSKQISPKLLKHFLKVTKRNYRPVLSCIRFDSNGSLSATDSHRVIRVENYHNLDTEFSINPETLQMEDGNYPSLDHLMIEPNDDTFQIKVDAEDLKAAVRAFGSQAKLGLKMTFNTDSLSISSVHYKSTSTLAVTMDAVIQNKGFDNIAFNGEYLLDGLMFATDLYKKLEDKIITIYFSESKVRPFMILPKNTNYKYLLTPIRTE